MASAAGLAFSQSLALAGAAEGIRSVAISIGGRFGDEGGLTRRNLIGRKADLDEVVGVIVASASKAGGFLTATNLVVDGGELAV
jgi:NAD(P)-dependent dehydrogenase (short-subunit alcohol dehydrogenase family)